MTRRDAIIAAGEYINSLSNAAKRGYAVAYNNYRRDGGTEPDRPDDLSYMAAQAVRLRIDAIWREVTR